MRVVPALVLAAYAAAGLLAGCQRNEENGSSIPETGEEQAPSILAVDQELVENWVVIDEVVSAGPGWVVIHTEQNRQPGLIIGHAPVQSGVNQQVRVSVDTVPATEHVYAVLYVDAGEVGVFEFPGADRPLRREDQPVLQRFALDLAPASLVTQVSGDDLVIRMASNQFEPKRLVLQVGEQVTWINDSDNDHTVTAEDHIFDSGVLEPGERFNFEFTQPGRYPYYCELHGGPNGRGMAGVIVVR